MLTVFPKKDQRATLASWMLTQHTWISREPLEPVGGGMVHLSMDKRFGSTADRIITTSQKCLHRAKTALGSWAPEAPEALMKITLVIVLAEPVDLSGPDV